MAMAANPPLSPPVAAPPPAENGEVSPQARRPNLSSPWAQVVRGVDSELPATGSSPPPPSIGSVSLEQTPSCSTQKVSTESSTFDTHTDVHGENSDNSDGNAGRQKKPAWNKPVNGVLEPSTVMGDSVSWPALSESTRSSTKSSSDSPKPASDGSAPSSSQGPIISQTPQKQVNTHHGMHRQRSMKHRGGGGGSGSGSGSGPIGGSAQSGYNRPPPPPPPLPPAFPVIEIPTYGNYGNFMPPPVLEASARGPRPMGSAGPQSGNDHSSHPQRNSSRRNNFGSRPRGDGQYHNNHSGRRDSDRRDMQMPHQFIPPPGSYMPPPPPPGSAPFIPAPHMRPFVGPMGFDMASAYVYVPTLPPEPFRGMPLIAQAPPAPIFFPMIDPPLPTLIIKQIDYYFSDANLVKDDYLRSNMDDEGWVPISLIASFPRVQQLTTDIQLILDSLRASVVVEVKEQGDKIRRRNEWQKWVHTGGRVSLDSGLQTPGTSCEDNLPTSIEKLSLNDDTGSKRVTVDIVDSQIEMPDRLLPGESSCPSNVDNGELTVEEVRSSEK